MWDENLVYPRIETGFAFKPHMSDVYVEAFNIKSFNRIVTNLKLRLKYYNPSNLIFQHLLVKEKKIKKRG